LVGELDEKVLKSFVFGNNPLENFLSLVDFDNYNSEDNLKTSKQKERVELVQRLLEALGFASAVDTQRRVDEESFRANWVCNILDEPYFRRHKRINELFDLCKTNEIRKDWSLTRVVNWINRILERFSLKLVREGGVFQLEVLNELLELIRRKNFRGRFFQDRGNLLRQETLQGDPFLDEATGETVVERRNREFDTSRLDWGVGEGEE